MPRRYRVIQGGPHRTPGFQETVATGAARLAAQAAMPQGLAAHGVSNPSNLPGSVSDLKNQIDSLLGIPKNPFETSVSVNPVSGDLNMKGPTGPSTGSRIGAILSGSPFGGELANYIGLNKGPSVGNTLGAGQHWRAIQGLGYGTELVSGKDTGRAWRIIGDAAAILTKAAAAAGHATTSNPGKVGQAVQWFAGRWLPWYLAPKGLVKWWLKHPGSFDPNKWEAYPIGGGIGPIRGFFPIGGGYSGARDGKAHLSIDQTRRLVTALNVIIHHLANAIGSGAGSGEGAKPTKAAERAILHGMTFPEEWVAYPRE